MPAGDVRVRLTWADPATGDPQERTLPLPITFGREAANTVALRSQQLSRQHARLELEQGRVVLADAGSTNGTFVNGRRIQRAPLQNGDSFEIGAFLFTVHLNPDQLVVRWADPQTGQRREMIATLPITIGREAGNTIILPGGQVSRRHALIDLRDGQLLISDQNSANGTLVNGQRHGAGPAVPVAPGDAIRIGDYALSINWPGATDSTPAISNEQSLVFNEATGQLAPVAPAPPVPPPANPPGASIPPRTHPEFPPPIFKQAIVAVADLQAAGLPVEAATYLAIGGGLGSFIWADNLAVSGADPRQIAALGTDPEPYARYQRLCLNSQIPLHERLRSNSDSCPDNLWGWPGYAVREIWDDLKRGDVGHACKLLWQIFGEPTLGETYTPRAGAVFAAIDAEAKRIGWAEIWRYGRVRAIRKTDDGRFAVAFSRSGAAAGGRSHGLLIAQHIQIATGYPAIQFLPDLQEYRQRTQDFKGIVNAYEDHEHVYAQLARAGGVVLLRGRGIVASRLIQRLYELRAQNPNIAILHLMRSPSPEGHRYGRAQRRVANHFEFQPFNWPKATWGGDLRKLLERSTPQQREQLLNDWGGTTTADRRDWRRMVEAGLREGWYQIEFGDVERVDRDPASNKLVTFIRGRGLVQNRIELPADFIIDATGLDAKVKSNPLLDDLVQAYGLELNAKGRLAIANDFEVSGMRNGPGRVYAAGAITLGGPYAPVDSFLGLQYAAQRSVDSLCELGAPGLRSLNGLRSLGQWLRWARGTRP